MFKGFIDSVKRAFTNLSDETDELGLNNQGPQVSLLALPL